MIVVDTSAIVAVLRDEPESRAMGTALTEERCVISAATLVELGMVVESRVGPAGGLLLDELLQRSRIEVLPVDDELARLALTGWRRFGKGRHPAALNFGDTFSYALATQLDAPLLFVGDDFSQTDVRRA